ncbi:MAG TPA: PAS domain S-box protein, partial [Rhodospirillales bacterium]|nr:PAS domain S-box protein [Rhodospirillales bacterium]
KPYAIDYRIITPNGDIRIVFEQNRPIIEDDRPVGISGTIVDATEKKLSETDLRDQYGMLQFLIDAIPIPVFHKNENGIFESCNKSFEEFFGVPRLSVIGNTVFDFLPESQAIEADTADKSLVRLGCALTYEAKEINGSGDPHDVIYYKTPLSNPDGSSGGIIAAMLDISERKHMEAALRESEKRFRIIAESSSDWFWETDENHKFIYVSERYQEILGQSPESVFGRSRWDLSSNGLQEQAKEKWRVHIADLNSHQPFRDFVYLFKTGDGSTRNVKISGIPVFDDANMFRGYRGSGTDVTEHIRVEVALRESEERHRNFAADVAHELRTPLAVLRTNLDNFEDTEQVKTLRLDVDGMTRMVTQLLAATRIETYVAADSFVSVNLADVCLHVATLLGPIAIKEQRSIEVLGGEDTQLIQGIQESLEQAVRNLAENAIRYSSRGTVISLKLGQLEDIPYISVIDRGRGIPKEQREAIFERFLRADRRTGGAGLGLSIVKRTVENHNAEIAIDDTPGGGATFTIRFPKSDAALQDMEVA